MCLDDPLTPIEVEARYREALLVVQSQGELLGRVWVPALSVIPVDVQRAAIAAELGWALWRQELRGSLSGLTSMNGGAEAPEPMRVSVVVCTHERPGQLSACLESLTALTTVPHEVIVVDNAPKSDETREVCARFPVRYVLEETPGTARARNRGIAEATGELIAFTDDDCVVDPHWLDGIGRNFVDPLVLAVTGPIEPLELETEAQYLIETHGVFTRINERKVYDGLAVEPVSAPYQLGATANACFRRDAFAKVGVFPEDFGAGTPTLTGEDPYVFYRILAAGYRIVADPAHLVWHQHRREYGRMRKVFFSYTLALLAHCVRCLVRHREPGSFLPIAHTWLRHFPRDLRSIVRREDVRIPLELLVSEVAGALLGPWRLVRTALARRSRPAPLEPPTAVPARARSHLTIGSDAPRLSVVVPSYNRREPLRTLLETLRDQRYPQDRFEVVAVVDGSTDGSPEMARSLELPYGLRVVEQENRGASAARNRGAEEATAPVLVFLDDDIVPEPSFLAEHALVHTGRPKLAVGYCPPAIGGEGLWALTLRAWWEDHFRRKAEPGHHWTWIDLTVGNLSVPRRFFLEAGGLDPDFKSRGREDWELGIRLLDQGVRFTYVPGAAGLHYVDTRFSTRLRQMRQEARDDILLSSKHPKVMGQLLLAELAQRLASGSSMHARAYRHPVASDRIARAALPVLGLLESVRLRGRWRRLAQGLLGHAYMRGVADVLPTPEELIAFFAPRWTEPTARVPVFLDRHEVGLPLPALGAVELELGLRQQSVARLSMLEAERQWGWGELAERVLQDESWPLLRAAVRAELSGFPEAVGESVGLQEEIVRAG